MPFAPPSLALVKLAQCRTGGVKDGMRPAILQQKPKYVAYLSQKERVAYQEVCFLTDEDVTAVEQTVAALDEDRSRNLNRAELQRLPELVFNPFTDRLVRVFDVDGSGDELDLPEVLDLFSTFSTRATSRAKAHIVFCVFDFDEDGEIGHADLVEVLSRMLLIPIESVKLGATGGKAMSRLAMIKGSPEEKLDTINASIARWAQEMIEELDTTGTGSISYDEWEDAITTCESFHDFASFPIASAAHVAAASKSLQKKEDMSSKKQATLKKTSLSRRNLASPGTSPSVRFENPLAGDPTADEIGTDGENADSSAWSSWSGEVEHWSVEHPAAAVLDGVPFLELIESDGFETALASALEPVEYEPEAVIVEKNQVGDMYFIAHGEVEVFNSAGEPLVTLESGGTFGEQAILSGQGIESVYKSGGATTHHDRRTSTQLYRLASATLLELLEDYPEAETIFLAPPEVRIAAKIRKLGREYSTPKFRGARPPSLAERASFHSQRKEEAEGLDAAEKSIAVAINEVLQVPAQVAIYPTNKLTDAVKQIENPLWKKQIEVVQARYGRGVSTTFQLQRWIGAQNLRVALFWLVFVILPRTYAVFEYCGLSFPEADGSTVCASKITEDADTWGHDNGIGSIAPDLEKAQSMEEAALSTGDAAGHKGDRLYDFHRYSGYAPALGSSFYLRHFTMAYFACIVFIYSTTVRSLLVKMRDVLAGQPVLGSGTESLSGTTTKSEGYFGILAAYDFSMRDAQSVAAMQDGIFVHLEVLEASRRKDDDDQDSLESQVRISVGWLLYLCLVALCGTSIAAILAEYWITDECCSCGCASCPYLSLSTNETSAVNGSSVMYKPDFCAEVSFNCDECSEGYKNPLVTFAESDGALARALGPYIQPLLLSITTALIPFLTKKVSLVEKRTDTGEEMRTILIRVFVLKIFNIVLMFLDLQKMAAQSIDVCVEDTVGNLFRVMVITDALVYTNVQFATFIFVKTVRRGKKIEYDSIRAAQEAINVMYRQVITWVATVTSPAMPAITFLVSNCLMGVEFLALEHNFRPPAKPWSAVKTVTSFMALTFLSLLISIVPSTVWLTGVRTCGPFEGIKPMEAPGIFLMNMLQNVTCHTVVTSVDSGDDIFDCEALQRRACTLLEAEVPPRCEWRAADGQSLPSVLSVLESFGQVVTSVPFLLSAVGVLASTIYFFNARLLRWQHEVVVLRESADGERKFLVKKLRALYEEKHGNDHNLDAIATMKAVVRGVKSDLDDLTEFRAENFHGAGTMPTNVEAYHWQHLETIDMTHKQKHTHKTNALHEREQKRSDERTQTVDAKLSRSDQLDKE